MKAENGNASDDKHITFPFLCEHHVT